MSEAKLLWLASPPVAMELQWSASEIRVVALGATTSASPGPTRAAIPRKVTLAVSTTINILMPRGPEIILAAEVMDVAVVGELRDCA